MRNIFLILTGVFLLSGCGSGSDSGRIFVPQSGHSENWSSFLTIGTEDFHGTVITSVSVFLPDMRGSILFVKHCAVCHGEDGTGKIGPNIQDATLQVITAALRAIPLMQGHANTLLQNEIEDIASYISLLREGAEPVRGVRDAKPCTECHGLNLDGGIAKISCFSCHNGPDGSPVHHNPFKWIFSKDDLVNFHGTYGIRFRDACRVCHGINLTGGIGPPCSACHDGNIAPIL
jgi:hypothetical protein